MISRMDASLRPSSPMFASESETWQLPHIVSVKGVDKAVGKTKSWIAPVHVVTKAAVLVPSVISIWLNQSYGPPRMMKDSSVSVAAPVKLKYSWAALS